MDQNNSKKPIASLILAGIVALLFWSELIFSNLPSLADVSIPAETLGWEIGSTRLYFLVLLVLDAVGGVGAIVYIGSILKSGRSDWLGKVVWLTVAALMVYGVFQFVIAFVLPQNLRIVYWSIGIAYVLMGFALRALYQRAK